jgi:hypothetical protein
MQREATGPSRIVLERLWHPVDAFALYHYLDAQGVPVSIQERPLRSAIGEIPFLEVTTALVLEDPSRLVEARALIEHYRSGLPGVRGATWICPGCGEVHEPMFGACWNCGTTRP